MIATLMIGTSEVSGAMRICRRFSVIEGALPATYTNKQVITLE
jgi:hypothetical protein